MSKFKSSRPRKIKSGIEGAEEVIKLLEDIGAAASEILEQSVEAGGRIALKDAKKRCPVDTGALQASLHIAKVKSNKPNIRQAVKISPGKQQYYGTFVELGTKGQAAQPYLRPAIDENKKQIANAINQEILKALGRIR